MNAPPPSAARRAVAAVSAGLLALGLASVTLAGAAPRRPRRRRSGQGFTVTPSDLAFILKQIKISEHHAATLTPDNPCGTLVGPGPNQIPDRLSPYGLRTVDGSCNNLFPGRETFAAADRPFPRLTTPTFRNAEAVPAGFSGRAARPTGVRAEERATSSTPAAGDQQPDRRPDLDQPGGGGGGRRSRCAPSPARRATCPAPPTPTRWRTRRWWRPGRMRALPPDAADPQHQHRQRATRRRSTRCSRSSASSSTTALDQTVKGGGTVFVPLQADDPLITLGPDGKPNTGDEVPPSQAFMVLTRAQNQPGPDGVARHRRRRAEREQHRLALGRPVADLRLARLAPGVPPRVRRQRRRRARCPPAGCSVASMPARPTPARRTAAPAWPPGPRSSSRRPTCSGSQLRRPRT